MDSRRRVGLSFSISEGWIGGVYYFLNIIEALKTLPDDQQPTIVIYSSDNSGFIQAKEMGYPYLEFESSNHNYSLVERLVNKIGRIILSRNLIVHAMPRGKVQVLFGYYEQLAIQRCIRKLYWIPDFQEHHYPEFIGLEVSETRKQLHQSLIASKSSFVFSSKTALHDFNTFYPYHGCVTSVVRFAVTHPDFAKVNFNDLKIKFGLPQKYFIVSNQFWPHKNHLVALKAMTIIKNEDVHLVFSGKMNKEDLHVKRLYDFAKENRLENIISFLGFIDRTEQLCIMKNSQAILQPSFFEGWSTVVEDAKALGKQVILSDLPVHREQMSDAIFFDATNELQLAEILMNFESSDQTTTKKMYGSEINQFALEFLSAIDKTIQS